MPKKSQTQDKMLAMIGGSSEPPKKHPKKEPPKKDTQKESSKTVGKGKQNLLNIPLKDFSPEVRKMLLAMIGGSSEPPKKQPKKEPPKKDTQKESSETVGKGKQNLLNIPLKDFSPEVRKMLVAGMVKGGKARVVKVKKTKEDKKSKEKK